MLGLPSTGGQKVRQVPLHFDDVGVSIANQYSVRPCELTRTVPLLVLSVLMPLADDEPDVVPAVLPEFDPLPEPPDPLLEVGLLVLPQAASRPTAAATTGAVHHRLIISISPFRSGASC